MTFFPVSSPRTRHSEQATMSEDRTLETEATGDETEEAGVSRRGALECMIWAGTGVLWILSGGVPKSLGLLGDDLLGNALA
jgi:hypothetical protein